MGLSDFLGVALYVYILLHPYIRGCHNYCYYEYQSCSQVHAIFLFMEPVLDANNVIGRQATSLKWVIGPSFPMPWFRADSRISGYIA
jgi:hypothetical protein